MIYFSRTDVKSTVLLIPVQLKTLDYWIGAGRISTTNIFSERKTQWYHEFALSKGIFLSTNPIFQSDMSVFVIISFKYQASDSISLFKMIIGTEWANMTQENCATGHCNIMNFDIELLMITNHEIASILTPENVQ